MQKEGKELKNIKEMNYFFIIVHDHFCNGDEHSSLHVTIIRIIIIIIVNTTIQVIKMIGMNSMLVCLEKRVKIERKPQEK